MAITSRRKERCSYAVDNYCATLKGVEKMGKESFADLEKIRLDILKEKIQNGIDEFKSNPGQQWTELRFEKPLLETLLTLIEKEEDQNEIDYDWILEQEKMQED
jgi:hypothetical protein